MHPNITTSNVIVSMSLFPQQQQLKGIILSKYSSKFRVIFDGFLSNLLFDPYMFLLSSFSLSVSIFSLILLSKPSPSLVWQLQYLLVSLLPVSFLSKSSHALLPDDSLSKPNPTPRWPHAACQQWLRLWAIQIFGLNLGSSNCWLCALA